MLHTELSDQLLLLPGFLGDGRCGWPLREGAGSPSGYLRALSCVECYGMKGYIVIAGVRRGGTAKVYWGDNGGNWEVGMPPSARPLSARES